MFNWIKSLFHTREWKPDWYVRPNTSAKIHITPETALRVSAVKQAVYSISTSIASLPLILYQRQDDDGREKATEHSLYNLLKSKPNPGMNKETFWQTFILNVLLYGAGYAEIVRDGAGRVQGLFPIPSDTVNVDAYNGTYRVDGQVINAEDLFSVVYMSLDGITPISPVTQAKEAIALAKRLELFTGAWFGNCARPSIVITSQKKVSPTAHQNMRESFRQLYGGDNLGDVGILEEGATLSEFGANNEQSQLRELSDWCVEEISRAFGITPTKLYSLGRATWGNLTELNTSFVTETLTPITKKIEGEIRNKLLTTDEQDTYFAEFLFDDLLKAKTLERYQVYQIAIANDLLTVDEVRAMENRNPLPPEETEQQVLPILDGNQNSTDRPDNQGSTESAN